MDNTVQPYVSTCPVGCSASLTDTTLALREGLLRQCGECGQLLSRITESAYWDSMQQFDQHEFNQPPPRELDRRFRVARRRLDTVSALLEKAPAALRVLDVGCSRGVEPAANIAAAARAQGLKVHTGLLADVALPAASFDAITLFEVIEHLKEPLPLLRECHRVLKPGGVLVLSTGNTASWTVAAMQERWDYFDIAKDGGHISFYNPRSIALLGTRAGFSTEQIATSRVKFHEKGEVARWRYAAGKLAAELLNLPARLASRGHDMLAFLRRN
ncbi:MAG: class I SAM-dependent methyltransferase [Betaproteobacteria bacterium]|nr:class I SAM-dependent methyltransferase [Betaproteobacteria bacterium]